MGRSLHLFAGTVALMGMGVAQAALVTPLCGPNICYQWDDDPNVNAGITAFGAPGLFAGTDTLEFTPTDFSASTSGTNGFDENEQTFQFERIWSKSGAEIVSIFVLESGDYQIDDSGSVNVNLRLQVKDRVDDVPGTPPSPFPETLTENFNFNSNIATGPLNEEWELLGTVNPAASFLDTANDIDLQIQNTLQARSDFADDSARIQKKLVLGVSVVPVPAAVWLFGSALGLLGWVRARSNQT